ncbi:MAG: hypothetical protein KME21_31120 [Desmonostoc vinosum HA7617-LM4]|jgi:hypothetical protein|nr:hypothetical protein [Desmonostoc vinosum HA7617-LM4]
MSDIGANGIDCCSWMGDRSVFQFDQPTLARGSAPLDFKGRYLVSISDADMLASAYVDGRLGAREGQDTMLLRARYSLAEILLALATAQLCSVFKTEAASARRF